MGVRARDRRRRRNRTETFLRCVDRDAIPRNTFVADESRVVLSASTARSAQNIRCSDTRGRRGQFARRVFKGDHTKLWVGERRYVEQTPHTVLWWVGVRECARPRDVVHLVFPPAVQRLGIEGPEHAERSSSFFRFGMSVACPCGVAPGKPTSRGPR